MHIERIWTSIAVIGALLAIGCSSAPPLHEHAISGRGGFDEPERRLVGGAGVSQPEERYCSAEVLRWRYDGPSATLRLSDARLVLNCCGQRGVRVERVDNVVEVTERDEPERGGTDRGHGAPGSAEGRCSATCTFDFSVGLPAVPPGDVYVKLLRDIVDEQGSPTLVWSGDLDLSRTSGALVLDARSPGPNCQQQMPIVAGLAPDSAP